MGGRKKEVKASMLANTEREPPEHRDREDGEEVEHAEPEQGHVGLQQPDDPSDRRDERRARDQAAQPPVPIPMGLGQVMDNAPVRLGAHVSIIARACPRKTTGRFIAGFG